jgi:hypothetical protein
MKKLALYSLLALSLFSLAGTGVAYAKGPNNATTNGNNQGNKGYGYENMLSSKAEVLGISIDELKASLAEGKTFLEIAEAQGLTSEDLHEAMSAQAESRINQRVANGTLTQEQADELLANTAERQGDCTGEGPIGQGNGRGARQGGQGQRLMANR